MNIKRKITFAIEKRKKNNLLVIENVPIRARVVFNGGRTEFFSGYRIDASKWDEGKEKVINGCTNKLKQSSSEINSGIQELSTVIDKTFKEFELKGQMPSFEEFKDSVKSKLSLKESPLVEQNLFTAFDSFILYSGKRNDWTPATYSKLNTVKNHLFSFKSNLKLAQLSESIMLDYVTFLRLEKGMRNSTIEKQLDFFKWFLKWCKNNGYKIAYNFLDFKPKLKETSKQIIFLTQEELIKIKSCDISSESHLDRVRDVLLFCCYSGLRYSDAYKLSKHNIKNDHIYFVTKKTNDQLKVELNKHTKAILDKYKDFPFDKNKVLPVISNQKMNEYLKILGKQAEINDPVSETYFYGNERIDTSRPKHEMLTTHVGRKTFICTALSLNIPAQVVMKWTGHKDYKSMRPYIDVADTIKTIAMNKFDTI